MKKTARAPANIAFIKYWGKIDARLRLPANTSISMNLSEAFTASTVEFSDEYKADDVTFLAALPSHKTPRPLDSVCFTEKEKQRIISHVDRIRKIAGIRTRVKVVTRNSFPKSAGVASSASGFAALTLAASRAAGLRLNEKELTIVAREGSGSAARSIPDGFVEWLSGDTPEESFARSLYPAGYWDIRDALVLVGSEPKKTSSSTGMEGASTSPFWVKRQKEVPGRIASLKTALAQKNFALLGSIIEEDCLNMHKITQTQIPPVYYWNAQTVAVMDAVAGWRKGGLAVYFTIDAGPNVHLIYEGKDENRLVEAINSLGGVKERIMNKASGGARLTDAHLF
jgi:diphosphomevalonate decarboxylase